MIGQRINLRNKGLTEEDPAAGDEWISGPFPIVRYIRLLYKALSDIEAEGLIRIPGPIKTSEDGQITVQVFPETFCEKLFLE
jgi:hypothetical protein